MYTTRLGQICNLLLRVLPCAVALLLGILVGSPARATELAGWDVLGQYYCGDSPLAPSNSAPHLTIGGLTRGSGVSVTSSASANAWGGVGLTSTSEAAAITANKFVTFSLTANTGSTISCTTIPAYNIRRSASGATTGIWGYQVGTGAFTDIGSAITWGTRTDSTGNSQTAINLAGISALQNVVAGRTITFRLVLWGASGGTGTWYFNDLAVVGDDLQVQGTVTTTITTPTITTVPTANAITYGQTLASASLTGGAASAPGSFAFTSPTLNPPVGTTSQSVTFTPTDLTSYNPVVFNINVTVNQATPGLTLVSSATNYGYGAPLIFTATLPMAATGSVIFATTNGAFSTNAISGGTAISSAISTLPRSPTNIIQASYSGDGNYLPVTNTLIQSVTNHPPVANANIYYRNGMNNWKIATSDLLTNTSDGDGDALTLISLGISTNGITLNTTSTPGYVQYASMNHANDQFSYTVADGYGGTNTAPIMLAYSSNGSLTGTSSISKMVCGNPTTLTACGIVNFNYITQRSTNVANPAAWVNIQTNLATNGVIAISDCFSDLNGVAPAQVYYRIMWSNN